MTKSLTTMIAVLALAAGLSAQHGKTEAPSLTGTWNMGLQGGHVIPVALVLKQDGATLTGTISMPTQRIGTTVDVALKGDDRRRRVHAVGLGRRRQGSDDHRDQGQAQRRRDARGPCRDERRAGTARRHAVHRRAARRSASETAVAAQRAERHRRDRRAPLPRGDGAGARARRRPPRREEDAPGLRRDGARLRRQLGDRRPEEPVGAGGGRPRLRPRADQPSIARAVSRSSSPSSATPTSTRRIRSRRRRSAAITSDRAHVLHAGAPEADAGRRRRVRHLARSAVRAAFRPGHARSRRCSCASRTSTRPAAAAYGYSCVYTDAISWAAPDKPLPMIRDPRVVFDRAVRRAQNGTTQAGARRAAAEDRSILDWMRAIGAACSARLGRRSRAARRLSR